jgi:hypothetical protein
MTHVIERSLHYSDSIPNIFKEIDPSWKLISIEPIWMPDKGEEDKKTHTKMHLLVFKEKPGDVYEHISETIYVQKCNRREGMTIADHVNRTIDSIEKIGYQFVCLTPYIRFSMTRLVHVVFFKKC